MNTPDNLNSRQKAVFGLTAVLVGFVAMIVIHVLLTSIMGKAVESLLGVLLFAFLMPFIGGFFSTFYAKDGQSRHALVFGLVLMVFSLWELFDGEKQGLWFHTAATLVLILPSAILGGKLALGYFHGKDSK